jgi:hypothetical protein
MGNIVVWFSCGAASAVAWKLTQEKYGSTCNVVAVNNPVAEEDPDNRRFAKDVAAWVGGTLVEWSNPAWPTNSAEDVWAKRRAMSFPGGAPCTVELKKRARQSYEASHQVDWHVLGFTSEELGRYERFILSERSNVLPVLIDANISKAECFEIVSAAGLQLPAVYHRGYPNANCLGCVKATSPTYWNHVRNVDPEVFERRAAQSRELGVRLARHKGERVFLDELPADAVGQSMKTMQTECGIFCEEEA